MTYLWDALFLWYYCSFNQAQGHIHIVTTATITMKQLSFLSTNSTLSILQKSNRMNFAERQLKIGNFHDALILKTNNLVWNSIIISNIDVFYGNTINIHWFGLRNTILRIMGCHYIMNLTRLSYNIRYSKNKEHS